MVLNVTNHCKLALLFLPPVDHERVSREKQYYCVLLVCHEDFNLSVTFSAAGRGKMSGNYSSCSAAASASTAFIIMAHSRRFFSISQDSLCDVRIFPV